MTEYSYRFMGPTTPAIGDLYA